jgi:hypothetical protein
MYVWYVYMQCVWMYVCIVCCVAHPGLRVCACVCLTGSRSTTHTIDPSIPVLITHTTPHSHTPQPPPPTHTTSNLLSPPPLKEPHTYMHNTKSSPIPPPTQTGLDEPSEAFWAPLGKMTGMMNAEDKVLLLGECVPMHEGTADEQQVGRSGFGWLVLVGVASHTGGFIRWFCPSPPPTPTTTTTTTPNNNNTTHNPPHTPTTSSTPTTTITLPQPTPHLRSQALAELITVLPQVIEQVKATCPDMTKTDAQTLGACHVYYLMRVLCRG